MSMATLFHGVGVVEVGGGLVGLIFLAGFFLFIPRLISLIQSDTWWTVASRDNLRVLYLDLSWEVRVDLDDFRDSVVADCTAAAFRRGFSEPFLTLLSTVSDFRVPWRYPRAIWPSFLQL